MAYPIPKIEYKNVVLEGETTLGDGTLTGLVDTTGVEVGMRARGAGVPAGATVGIVTENTITLADGVLCTVTDTEIEFDFGYVIEFDFPPVEPDGENLETKAATSESLSGIRQVSVNYVEAFRKLKFSFLSPAIYTLVDSFLKNHALNGGSFRYYEDKTLTDYIDYELDALKVAPKKIAPRSATTYVWEVPLTFRRAL